MKLLFCGGVKRSVEHMRMNAQVTAEEQEQVRRLLEHLKLDLTLKDRR